MDQQHVATITRDRFREWEKTFTDCLLTPFACIGIGHGVLSGTVHLVISEHLPNDQIIELLESFLKERKQGRPMVIRSPLP